jgi:hypothetical protein
VKVEHSCSAHREISPLIYHEAWRPDELVATNTINSRDLVLGTLIAGVMAAVFTLLSSGSSLLVTFVSGIAVTWAVFVLMYYPGSALPDARSFLPAFFTTLAIQFIQLGEEFAARFTDTPAPIDRRHSDVPTIAGACCDRGGPRAQWGSLVRDSP